MRFVGLDVGQKTVGIAVSDELELVAHPLRTIARRPKRRIAEDCAEVMKLVEEYAVAGIVVGMPYTLAGAVETAGRRSLAFCEALRTVYCGPIETWDERFSTVEAQKNMIEAQLPRSRRHERIDAEAAAYILQSYLDDRAQRAAVERGPGGSGRGDEVDVAFRRQTDRTRRDGAP
jgi:putative Holliday junction resolvase